MAMPVCDIAVDLSVEVSPQTTPLPQTTLKPEVLLSPQTTELPHTTESPQTTLVPHTNELPQMTLLPQITLVPSTKETVCVLWSKVTEGDIAEPFARSLLASAAGMFR